MNNAVSEINRGERFAFGSNWRRFLDNLDEHKIKRAEESLCRRLRRDSLRGLRFLDAGCGSGLFSLAARRLGAEVYSFDFDPESVACTAYLRNKFFPGDAAWIIEVGNVLDHEYIAGLGLFDIVYSWGVLHHTGAMWDALANILIPIKKGGTLFIAIYNDAGRRSNYWKHIKHLYVKHPMLRPFIIAYAFMTTRSGWILRGILQGNPMKVWNAYGDKYRGMSAWHDLIDWVGGYPYEYAKPEEVFVFYFQRGGRLIGLSTMGGGTGCNEFVFLMESGGYAS